MRARGIYRRLFLYHSSRPSRIVKNSPNIINQTGPNITPYRFHSRNITRRIPVFAAAASTIRRRLATHSLSFSLTHCLSPYLSLILSHPLSISPPVIIYTPTRSSPTSSLLLYNNNICIGLLFFINNKDLSVARGQGSAIIKKYYICDMLEALRRVLVFLYTNRLDNTIDC